MLEIADNVRNELMKLVPSSTVSNISCFRFFDKHPQDCKKLDIIVGTSLGEIKEYFLKELVSSAYIGSKASKIALLRNNKCELFYIVTAEDEIFILSRKEKVEVMHHLKNIERYEIEDSACLGLPSLKVIRKDDAVPLYFDENLQDLSEQAISFNHISSDDCIPLVRQLLRKLTEAKYIVQCNEKAYQDLVKLRQQASFSDHGTVKDGPLVLKNCKPYVKCCNGKVVIILDVQSKRSLQNINILLHGSTRPSMTYTTKLYLKTPEAPYWQQTKDIQQNLLTTIVCIINLNELRHNIAKLIEFNGTISYKIDGKHQLMPFENVIISALDTMGEEFDVLYRTNKTSYEDNLHLILATIATSHEIDLIVRHIRKDDETTLNFIDLLCQYLKMEKVSNDNIAVHRISPFHTLHGVMVVMGKCEADVKHVTVHTRHESQILALMNYINDAIPYRIAITSNNQTITSKHKDQSQYTENPPQMAKNKKTDYEEYGFSVLQQSSAILEYLDSCMIKMNESKNPEVVNKVGSEIDMFAAGVENFKEFRNNMFQEARRGIVSVTTLHNTRPGTAEETEGMIIDSD